MKYDLRFPSITDLENQARKRIPRFALEYLCSGIGEEFCLDRNRKALNQITLWPRYLTDIREVNTNCHIFDHEYSLGLGVSPVGLGNMMWPNTETILASAAQRHNIPYILSTMSTTPLERIRSIAPDVSWFQLYVPRDEAIMSELIQRVNSAGFRTLVVTVDIPVGAKRDRELKNGLNLPFRYTPKIVRQVLSRPRWMVETIKQGIPSFVNIAPYIDNDIQHLSTLLSEFFMSGVTTKRLEQIRTLWSGKIIVKGLMHQQDIQQCIDMGIDGVILSNHGGRQLDAAASSIEALQTMPDTIKHNITMLLDGGIRCGLDVVRAKALGATGVFSGRSFFFATGAMGSQGGDQAIEIFRDEITRTLQQLGCTQFQDMDESWLR